LLFRTFEGVAGKVSTGKEAVTFISQMPVDMVVPDLQMPEQSGIETLLQLRTLQPMFKVMILTMIYPLCCKIYP
jgi:DNA-binding NarL/FixJ family response regulator